MPTNLPFVSILVAARNEEKSIERLLRSLDALSYPKEKLQILIGNDASTDKTSEVVRRYIITKREFELVEIEQKSENLKGKTNVLAQLAHKANGDFFFYTDADIAVPTNWIEAMLRGFQEKTGVTVGATIVQHSHWFEACQAIEWLLALQIMKKMSDFMIPSTGMGNNMAVRAEAYWSVGGYENLAFSIIEDYALYQAILKKGYGFAHIFEPSVLALTLPPSNYFEQRKRWISGGMTSNSNLMIPALLQASALPLLGFIGFFSWKISLCFFLLLFLGNFISGFFALKTMKKMELFRYLPLYTVYALVFWFLQFFYYFLPTKLVWKERSY